MRYVLTLLFVLTMAVNAEAFTWFLKSNTELGQTGHLTDVYAWGNGYTQIYVDGNASGWTQVVRCGQNEAPGYATKFMIVGTDVGSENLSRIMTAFNEDRQDWLTITHHPVEECVDFGEPMYDFIAVGYAQLFPGGEADLSHPVQWIQATYVGNILGNMRTVVNPCNTMETNGNFIVPSTAKQGQILDALLGYKDGDFFEVVFDGCVGTHSKISRVDWVPQ